MTADHQLAACLSYAGRWLHEVFYGGAAAVTNISGAVCLQDWLYDEGEDQSKSVYHEKLQSLRTEGDPIETRCASHTEHRTHVPPVSVKGRFLGHEISVMSWKRDVLASGMG